MPMPQHEPTLSQHSRCSHWAAPWSRAAVAEVEDSRSAESTPNLPTPKAEVSAWSTLPRAAGADLAGIRANDVIIAINGASVRELDYQTIVERLRGPVGSTVQLDVFRNGEVNTVAVMRQAYTK